MKGQIFFLTESLRSMLIKYSVTTRRCLKLHRFLFSLAVCGTQLISQITCVFRWRKMNLAQRRDNETFLWWCCFQLWKWRFSPFCNWFPLIQCQAFYCRCIAAATCRICSQFQGDYCNLPSRLYEQLKREGFPVESKMKAQGCYTDL